MYKKVFVLTFLEFATISNCNDFLSVINDSALNGDLHLLHPGICFLSKYVFPKAFIFLSNFTIYLFFLVEEVSYKVCDVINRTVYNEQNHPMLISVSGASYVLPAQSKFFLSDITHLKKFSKSLGMLYHIHCFIIYFVFENVKSCWSCLTTFNILSYVHFGVLTSCCQQYYTLILDLFVFRFVSLLCLRSTLRQRPPPPHIKFFPPPPPPKQEHVTPTRIMDCVKYLNI